MTLIHDLTFDAVSHLNSKRSKLWHGGKEWSLSDWAVALAGECGELCNVVKKLNRIRDNMPGNKAGVTKESLEKELIAEVADVYLYLDLFCEAAGIDLPSAIKMKFNEVSQRVGFKEQL
jgi:NTP pyrophosphatase (non-canonical NTP hydrolase)